MFWLSSVDSHSVDQQLAALFLYILIFSHLSISSATVKYIKTHKQTAIWKKKISSIECNSSTVQCLRMSRIVRRETESEMGWGEGSIPMATIIQMTALSGCH